MRYLMSSFREHEQQSGEVSVVKISSPVANEVYNIFLR